MKLSCFRVYTSKTSFSSCFPLPAIRTQIITRKYSAMEAIKKTVAENFGGASHNLVSESQQFSLEQIPSLKGKVAVVTGGSEGIGYGCTQSMLSKGIDKLFILSVSKDVVDGAISAIREELGDEAAAKVTWLQCDLSDWKKTKATADQIASSTDRLDILINNAARGIMTFQLTDYGVDRHVRPQFQSHSLFLEANCTSTDGTEPLWPRNLDIPTSPSSQENRVSILDRPHCQSRIECASSHAILYPIRQPRGTQSRPWSQWPVRSFQACCPPLRPISSQTSCFFTPKHSGQCQPPGLCRHKDVE